MQSVYGQKSTFTATDANLRINIEDLVVKYPDYKFPALKRLSGKVFKKEVLSHKYEWTERDLRPISALVLSEVGQSAVSVTVDAAGVFNLHDIVENKRTGERMLVNSVSGGVNLSIERGFQSTASVGSALIEGDILVRVGVAAPEGAESRPAITIGAEDFYNYTQTFTDTVFMSDSQYKGFIHGDETQTDAIQRIQQELMESLHIDLFTGRRYRNAAQKVSTFGGMKYFVDTYATDNAIDFGGASTWSTDTSVLGKFEDAVQQIADKMGGKPTIYATYSALRKLRLVQDDTVRTTKTDKSRGVGVVDTYLSGMGELDIVQLIDRSGVLNNLAFFVDEANVGFKAKKGRGWFTEERPFDGDGHKMAVVGEYTMKIETPKATVAYLHNLGI
jgi:hypothetical protein